jgi:hypothetical protein
MVVPFKPYPCAPTLARIFAMRCTDPLAAMDTTIAIEAAKGTGKSTFSLELAEETAKEFANILGGKPEDYFDFTHVVSVETNGALELLTSGKLQAAKHQIYILDDVSVQWNSRRSMTTTNQLLNDILTISRIFESVIICNLVNRNNSDLILRQMTDYLIRMHSRSTITKQSLFKCYKVEQRPDGTEILKYLTWTDPKSGKQKRIKWWIGGLPSEELNEKYKALRLEKTISHIEDSYEKYQTKILGVKKGRKEITYADNPTIVENRQKVTDMINCNTRVSEICRRTGLSRHWVEKIDMLNRGVIA